MATPDRSRSHSSFRNSILASDDAREPKISAIRRTEHLQALSARLFLYNCQCQQNPYGKDPCYREFSRQESIYRRSTHQPAVKKRKDAAILHLLQRMATSEDTDWYRINMVLSRRCFLRSQFESVGPPCKYRLLQGQNRIRHLIEEWLR